jgi:hypothetical protein
MARIYETPGVYFERTDATSGIIGLRTDIAGFAGIAESGPVHCPVPIESWRQFESYFGSFIGTGYLAYAVRAFFQNGGRRGWIVRVASDASARASINLTASGGPPTWLRIEAISEGVWGNEIEITIQETHRAQTKTVPSPTLGVDAIVQVIAGFSPRVLVRFSQPAAPSAYRVITAVDSDLLRLSWTAPLAGFDPTQPISIESVEYTLLVRRAGRLVRTYTDLAVVPGHPRFGPDLLPTIEDALEKMRTVVLPDSPEPIAIIAPNKVAAISPVLPLDLSAFHNIEGGRYTTLLSGGTDGLATLRPFDFIGEEPALEDSEELRRYKRRGITALNTVDEIAIVAIPDIHIRPQIPRAKAPLPSDVDPCVPSCTPPPIARPAKPVGDLPPVFSDEDVFAVQAFLVESCEGLHDRIAVLDAPYSAVSDPRLGTTAIRRWRNRFDSSYAGLYYPWLRVVDPLSDSQSLVREIPPSGHVAGVMARGDLEIGVHKAPANVELTWAEELTAAAGEAEHGLLNTAGINVLRLFPGRGIRIFGARTMSSDGDWRFINVRRLLMMIEESIDESLQWVVFEPNDHITRTKVTLCLRTFLTSLWQRGALIGQTPDDSFYVKCTDDNNPPSERANGRLLAEVGVAASQPFEFVVLRVGRVNNALDIAEIGLTGVQV